MDAIVSWIVRSVHVFGAAVWLGGYAVMLLVIVPGLARDRGESMRRLGVATSRLISWAGALTVLAGLVLIWRTRGYGFLLAGEWGGIIIVSFVLAIVMGALGDVALKPAIRRLTPETTDGIATIRRWAVTGLVLGMVILLLMTRAIYART